MADPAGRTLAMGADGADHDRSEKAPFGRALVEVARRRAEVVGLSADLARYTDIEDFSREFPDRFFNAGMAEQNLLALAAGLAQEGFTPVATTYGVFATRRALDFLVAQCALVPLDVKIVAGLPGLTTGYGGTHQAIDDLAHVRAIPNLVVIDPADAVETREATLAMLDYRGPVYMRLLRGAVPVVLGPGLEPFRIGHARLLREGSDVSLVACGVMVARALEAADILSADGISAAVLNASTLKPFDAGAVCDLAGATGAVVTAENHSVIGGLHSAVCEAICAGDARVPVEAVGLRDEFGGFGSLDYLAQRHGMRSEDIVAAARRAIERRHA